MKTTKLFKANGKTFYSMDEVQTYANNNNFVIVDTYEFEYKSKTIVSVNLKSVE